MDELCCIWGLRESGPAFHSKNTLKPTTLADTYFSSSHEEFQNNSLLGRGGGWMFVAPCQSPEVCPITLELGTLS